GCDGSIVAALAAAVAVDRTGRRGHLPSVMVRLKQWWRGMAAGTIPGDIPDGVANLLVRRGIAEVVCDSRNEPPSSGNASGKRAADAVGGKTPVIAGRRRRSVCSCVDPYR